jgi:hypothetical protein
MTAIPVAAQTIALNRVQPLIVFNIVAVATVSLIVLMWMVAVPAIV